MRRAQRQRRALRAREAQAFRKRHQDAKSRGNRNGRARELQHRDSEVFAFQHHAFFVAMPADPPCLGPWSRHCQPVLQVQFAQPPLGVAASEIVEPKGHVRGLLHLA